LHVTGIPNKEIKQLITREVYNKSVYETRRGLYSLNENLALQRITLIVVTGLWVSGDHLGELGVDVELIFAWCHGLNKTGLK
jgi:hypothetical protein